MRFLSLALALAAGNFFYQALGVDVPNYMVAFERSYFEAIGLFVGWWAYAEPEL